ncbi:GNAT family acetyltransferase [Rhizocola hellebori]|uniref:GNAT family acetyltransferase n=2 Tax=Rhizocola hellebori TaxID=1392758 RepID=A0A8J3VJB4_9ACTN|nr:GNAT family acetyltransferase [Rhizocola hellebori]
MAASLHGRQLRVLPVTEDRWDDVVACFGRRGNDPQWCWCQRFVGTAPDRDQRAALRRQMTAATVPFGLVAFVDEQPVGWSRVSPRSDLPGVLSHRALKRILPEDSGAWWATCFVVDARHRGQGVGHALLNAAVSHARDHGATAVEGHPVDVEKLAATRVSGSSLFTGTLAMFAAAGFTEIGRTFPSRPVMRLQL